MNVFDWLSEIPLTDGAKPFNIIEVSFNKGSRKDYFRNGSLHTFVKGEWIAVEGTGGFDVGQVNLQGELVRLQMKKYGITDTAAIKKVLRPAGEEDLKNYDEQKGREQEIMVRSRAMARQLKLDMKIAEVELQADGRKGTFFYTAEQRVDFRELIKLYATDFRMKVEMRQIGARQESGKVGGIGSCGRELCCATWLSDFKSVNTAAARYQNLSINQTKLSGQCGRLKCCLNYELDTYMDALRGFPTDADTIETAQGRASLQKRDIFRNVMWYSYYGSNKQYPLSIERVLEIKALNKDGIKPEELGAAEIEKRGPKPDTEVDKGFVNDVGQISLKALERNSRNRKKKAEAKGQKANSEQNAQAADNLSRPHRPQKQQGGGQQGGGQPQNQQKQQGQKPKQEKKQGDRPQGEKPQGNRPQGERPQGEKPQGDKNQMKGPRPEGESANDPIKKEGGSRRSHRNRHRGNKGGDQGGDKPATPDAG
jgi:cell fate regulator YaaT (PSP1 superfamily)